MSGDELRAVMRRFPAGIAVVTVDADGDRLGITVGSLVSLSLDPPLVGVAVGRELAAHELIRHAGGYAVSILSADQDHLARRFARGVPPIAQWVGVGVREGRTAPLLEGALGWLECELHAEHRAGDHTLFIGRVVTAEPGAPGRGLAYRESAYRPV